MNTFLRHSKKHVSNKRAKQEQNFSTRAQFALLAEFETSYFVPSAENLIKSAGLLAEATAELSQLEYHISKLQKRKDSLQDISAALRQYASPVRRLSTEILQKIFLYAATRSPGVKAWDFQSSWWKAHEYATYAEYEDEKWSYKIWTESKETTISNGSHFGDPSQPPWSISAVCRRWRAIAKTTPSLWSYIELNTDSKLWQNLSQESCDVLLGLYLKRSLPHGLDLVFIGEGEASDLQSYVFQSLKHSERWKRLLFSPENPFSQQWPKEDWEFRQLQSVALDAGDFSPNIKLPSVKTWYKMPYSGQLYPKQYCSTITNYYHCEEWEEDQLPTAEPRLKSIATEFTRLHTLTISLPGTSPALEHWPDRIVFPTVVNLNLGLGQSNSTCRLLGLLLTPSLRTLRLHSLKSSNSLIPFITQCKCALSALRADDAALDSASIRKILRHTPHLEQLHLTFYAEGRGLGWQKTDKTGYIDNKLLERLFDPLTTTVPGLRQTHLINVLEVDSDHMLEILRGRFTDTTTMSQLEHIRIISPYLESSAPDDEMLRSFRCKHRVYIEFGLWVNDVEDNSSDNDSDSEAEFTSSQSSHSSNNGADEASEVEFDWYSSLSGPESTSDSDESFESPEDDSEDDSEDGSEDEVIYES